MTRTKAKPAAPAKVRAVKKGPAKKAVTKKASPKKVPAKKAVPKKAPAKKRTIAKKDIPQPPSASASGVRGSERSTGPFPLAYRKPPLTPEICPASAAKDEEIDWETIRAEYEIGTRLLSEIARDHGIHSNKILGRARKETWPKRAEVTQETALATELPEDAEALAARLTKLIAREIADIERQSRVTRDDAEGERQARRLSSLVRSIDKLHEIEQAARLAKKHDPASDKAKRAAEDKHLRAELEQRLARLFAAADADGVRERADAEGSSAPH